MAQLLITLMPFPDSHFFIDFALPLSEKSSGVSPMMFAVRPPFALAAGALTKRSAKALNAIFMPFR